MRLTRLFGMAAFAAALCAGGLIANNAAAADLEEVTFLLPAPPNLPGFAPFVLADSRGYYAAEGLKVKLVSATGTAALLQQVGAGNAPFGAGSGDVPIFLRPNGVPVKIVALVGGKSPMHVAVWEDDKTINTPADLRGKTVATISYQDGYYYTFLGMIAQFGMTKNDMDVQAVGNNANWQVFANRKTQALISNPDYTALAEGAGAKVKLFQSEDYFPTMPMGIFASDETIRTRPELIKKVVRASMKAMGDIIKDPDAGVKDFLAATPSMKDNATFISNVIHAYAKNVFPGQKRLGEVNVARLQNLQDFYAKEKLVAKITPIDELYTNQFIE